MYNSKPNNKQKFQYENFLFCANSILIHRKINNKILTLKHELWEGV